MTHEEQIFGQALPLGPAERRALLDAACGPDHALRARLEALLQAHAASEKFLAGPSLHPPAPRSEESAGAVIGRYTLVRPIGEGGCGIVYLADQTEPVRRRVALKVIKLGMDTRQVIARFEAERQALAMMDHPDIAHVLDAGTTPAGRPYFVMEYVDGVPITKFCDAHHLSVEARLELFVRVCLALQHAHQKGIIHRDIKPSNILVSQGDGTPVPKIIDFGIAKATQGRLTEATLITGVDQLIGTPAYMSPEQAELRDLDVDTRSDVYSLGVLLYELLVGRPPFDPKSLVKSGMEEIRRIIREVEPPRPSTLVATLGDADRDTIARQRCSASTRLSSLLRGDLDWIVMRCLEKDRARRYNTAHELAEDIRHHLHSEPVIARPPSPLYRAQKFISRNRFACVAVAAVLTSLVLGTVISLRQAIRATRAEREQTRLRTDAERLSADALAARERADFLRQAAETKELAARRLAYASDMNAVQRALEVNSIGRARELLDRNRPKPGVEDLRGWEWRYLWQFARSEAQSVVREADGAEIRSVAISADGQWVALAMRNGDQLAVRNLATREEILVPTGPAFYRYTTAFSPREPLLAMAITDKSPGRRTENGEIIAGGAPRILLWDLNQQKAVRELALNGRCIGLAFSEDGQTLVAGEGLVAGTENTGAVTVWRVADGTRLAKWPGGYEFGNTAGLGFAVTRDASAAANVVADNNIVRVIDLATGRERWRTTATKVDSQISALAFSPDGRVLATGAGYSDSDIRLWDAMTGQPLGRLQGQRGWTAGLVFLADGRHLLSASGDQSIRLWDLKAWTTERVFRGHKSELMSFALAPDQRTLFSGCKDGSAYLWDLRDDRHAAAAGTFTPTMPRAFTFADARGDAIVTADRDSRIVRHSGPAYREDTVLLDFATNTPTFAEKIRVMASPVFAHSRPLLAAFMRDTMSLQVWDWERRALVQKWEARAGEANLNSYPLHFTHDGTTLLVVVARPSGWVLRELDVATGRETRNLPAPPTMTRFGYNQTGTLLSPDENELIDFGDATHPGVRFELAAGRVTTFALDLLQRGNTPTWTPDGKLIVLPSRVGFVRIMDAATYQPVATLSGFMFGAHSAKYSPDRHRLAIGGNALEAVTIWDTHNYERLVTLAGEAGLELVAFSSDGNTLAGARNFWRAPSWAEIEQAESAERAAAKK